MRRGCTILHFPWFAEMRDSPLSPPCSGWPLVLILIAMFKVISAMVHDYTVLFRVNAQAGFLNCHILRPIEMSLILCERAVEIMIQEGMVFPLLNPAAEIVLRVPRFVSRQRERQRVDQDRFWPVGVHRARSWGRFVVRIRASWRKGLGLMVY